MTLQTAIQITKERWKIIGLITLAGIAAGLAFWYLTPKQYTSSITLYVSAQGAENNQTAFQGAQLSQQRVTSYVQLVQSRRVASTVINELGLDTTPEELQTKIAASSALDSVLITVSVRQPSAQDAATIANTVGRVFADLVDELEQPAIPGNPPSVAVRIVEPAPVPVRPSSTGLSVLLVAGFFVGLTAGIALAIIRNLLDNTLKSLDQLRSITHGPVLGVIAYDPAVPRRPLTVHDDPQSPRAETFRQLRTNLAYIDVDRPPKVIALSSALPGEGKTTTVANLAIAFAASGQRVLAIEADLRRPSLSNTLGLEQRVGLTTVLAGRARVEQAIQNWPAGGIDLLASGPLPPNPSELLGSGHMAALLSELRPRYDIILLDTPPILPVTDTAAIARQTDGVILLCRFKSTTLQQLEQTVQSITAVSARLLGTIFSMVPKTGPRSYASYSGYYARTEASDTDLLQSITSQNARQLRPSFDRDSTVGPLPRPGAASQHGNE